MIICGGKLRCYTDSTETTTVSGLSTVTGGSLPSVVTNSSARASSVSLHNQIFLKNWKTVELVCRSDPWKAKVVDQMGDLPLHEACLQGAPINIIQVLLSAYPAGIKKIGFCERLPLHYASYNNPSLKTIKFLLKKFPDAALATDSDGRLPLHLAVIRSAPKECVQVLIPPNSKSLNSQTNYGNTPRMLATSNNVYSMLNEEENQAGDGSLKSIDNTSNRRLSINSSQKRVQNKQIKIQIAGSERGILVNKGQTNKKQRKKGNEESSINTKTRSAMSSKKSYSSSEFTRHRNISNDDMAIPFARMRSNEETSINKKTRSKTSSKKSHSSAESTRHRNISNDDMAIPFARRKRRGRRRGAKSVGRRVHYSQGATKTI